ncbi:MAG: YhdP family protein, partial [Gammaproteobacteria bacterium]
SIERLAGRALGNPVSIARIYASWHGLHPSLFLGDVVLRDRAGRQVLHLPSVSATVSWWSLVTAQPRFASLEIIRPDLDVRRDPDGKLYVAGMLLQDKTGGGDPDWAFKQHQIVIREGTIHWTDQRRGAPELVLDNVDMVLLNRWRHHQFTLRAAPPATLAAPIDVRADFTHPHFAGRISDARLWRGELYASLADTDLAVWKQYLDFPFALSRGKGSLRAWVSLDRGRLAGFTADLGLVDVSARLARELPQLDLARVQGRMSASEPKLPGRRDGQPAFGANGHTITLTRFSLATADGLKLAPTTLAEVYTPARGASPEKIEISAQTLDLETLAQAGSAAMPALPGFANLSGNIDATEKGGSMQLDSPNLVLHLPAWFADPSMPFDQFDMAARWTFLPNDKVELKLDALKLAQGRLKAELSGTHLIDMAAKPGHPAGIIDLSGKLSGFEIDSIARFLPMQTPEHLRDWLSGALQGGVADDVSLRLRGDLAHFPFRAGTPAERAGEFRIAGRIENGRLNYAPGHLSADGKGPLWPQAERINGSFVFERTRMEINGDTARTLGANLSNVKAVVEDLASPERTLEIDGTAAAPMQEFLNYVAASPVLGWIGHFTEDSHATGNAKLALKLRMPLTHMLDTKVNGTLQLAGNDVVLFPDLPPLQAAIGKIEFNEHGVALNGVGASFLGGPLAVTGGTQRDNSIAIRVGGTVTAEGVKKHYASPAVAPVVAKLSGGTRYNGLITFKDHQLKIDIDSNLVGVGLNFPAPLVKTEAEELPAHFSLVGLPGVDGMARDELRLSIGNSMAARYLRQRAPKSPWTVLQGGIGVNVPAPEPDSGLMVNADMKQLNVDQWIGLGSAVASAARAARAESGEPGDGAAAGGPDMSQYVVPDVVAARAGELIIGERRLDHVVVGATHQKGAWQVSLDSQQISGHLTWDELSGGGLGKVTARLASLVIPESSADAVKDLLEDGKSAASSIPALDIVAERFELFNKQLGRLELVANNLLVAAGREWRINKLSLVNPDGTLSSTGKWVSRNGQSSTSLNFNLDIADAGRLLERMGFPDTLKRGKGKLAGDIAWSGLPYSLDIPSLSGQIAMNVASGQFLKQEPGAAKLLGVLSLQMLPRLLKLDFHDVFSEGLAFDGISADATITRGVLRTDNLKMHGVAATVLMAGNADIANESTNLHVVVIPEFNLGTGPLVYALAVNPVVGLGSFLAQLFLRAPVMKALTYEMQVTGPWKAPTITKLGSAKAPARTVQ